MLFVLTCKVSCCNDDETPIVFGVSETITWLVDSSLWRFDGYVIVLSDPLGLKKIEVAV